MHQSDLQHRSDARELLRIAVQERAEYVKLFARLQNNVTMFVDRSNHELAALALAIRQKDENIATLAKAADGYFVEPKPPITAVGQAFEAPGDLPTSSPSDAAARAGAAATPTDAAASPLPASSPAAPPLDPRGPSEGAVEGLGPAGHGPRPAAARGAGRASKSANGGGRRAESSEGSGEGRDSEIGPRVERRQVEGADLLGARPDHGRVRIVSAFAAILDDVRRELVTDVPASALRSVVLRSHDDLLPASVNGTNGHGRDVSCWGSATLERTDPASLGQQLFAAILQDLGVEAPSKDTYKFYTVHFHRRDEAYDRYYIFCTSQREMEASNAHAVDVEGPST